MLRKASVLLLKDAGVVSLHCVAISVVLAVLFDGIDEEQAQYLNALRAEALLFV